MVYKIALTSQLSDNEFQYALAVQNFTFNWKKRQIFAKLSYAPAAAKAGFTFFFSMTKSDKVQCRWENLHENLFGDKVLFHKDLSFR